MKNSVLWWIFAIIFTMSIAVYQRVTGPTYPVKGRAEINGHVLKSKLLTSNDSDEPAKIEVEGATEDITGLIEYKKFKTNEAWQKVPMQNKNGKLTGEMPQQPPAGKLVYKVTLEYAGQSYSLSDNPVVLRFKGPVPLFILLPHILLMFLAMLFSTRTGIEALIKGDKTYRYSLYTLIFLLLGGLFLGPVVQKYAFGELWTGWPFGGDLTDNKTFVAFLAWVIAWWRLRKDPTKRGWVIAAAIILLLVYLIPHSMFGSELDYNTGVIETGK